MKRTKTLLPEAAHTTSGRLVSLLKELLRGSVAPSKCFTGNPEDQNSSRRPALATSRAAGIDLAQQSRRRAGLVAQFGPDPKPVSGQRGE